MLEHRYDIRISESYVDPNPLMVEIQDPDNFTRFQTRERCALEKAAYDFKVDSSGKESINILLAMSPEPSLLAYIKYGCRLRRNSKFRLVSVGALGAFACDKKQNLICLYLNMQTSPSYCRMKRVEWQCWIGKPCKP